jgi:hypothetical protein
MSDYEDEDRPVLTPALVQAILKNRSPKLADPKNKAILDQQAAAFRDEISGWKINRFDEESPPLSPEMQAILIEAFRDLVENFDKAAVLPERLQEYSGIVQDGPAAVLQHRLLMSKAMQDYRGNHEQAAYCLVGSAIDRAVQAGVAINLEYPRVRYKYISPGGAGDKNR